MKASVFSVLLQRPKHSYDIGVALNADDNGVAVVRRQLELDVEPAQGSVKAASSSKARNLDRQTPHVPTILILSS
jgi:hypothetical protein